MKRFRKKISPQTIRYYHCGEYGEKFRRPHYHAIIFGYDFKVGIEFDEKEHVSGEDEYKLYISPWLNEVWGKGAVTIGAVTFESAAYVARYILKKVTGKNAVEHYIACDENGEVINLQPEYTTMSRRPGIGFEWYQKYKNEVYPDNFIIVRGKKMKPPKYYERFFEIDEPAAFKIHKMEVARKIADNKPDNTTERLAVREKVARAKNQTKSRDLEKI